jgi:hypothetical protein
LRPQKASHAIRGTVYIVTRKDKLLQAQPKNSKVVAEKDGFSENGGPMTVLLISNGAQR